MSHQRWLFKEDPEAYSLGQLQQEKSTLWSGVHNPLALIHLRRVKKGDPIFFYATGKQKSIVGIMEALAAAQSLDGTLLESAKEVGVQVAFQRELPRPVPLAAIRNMAAFRDSLLLKISRLSVLPVSEAQWLAILQASTA